MTYDHPYEDIAKDAMAGRQVAVFCENSEQVKPCKNGIAAAAKRLGARQVVFPLRDRRITIDGNPVRLLLANGFDGRGMSFDVVYLSESARYQFEFARTAGAVVQ